MAQYTFNELNTLTGSLNRLRKEYPILAFIFAERFNKWEFDNKAGIDVLRVESNKLYQEATIYLFNLSCIFLKELILNKIVTFYDSFSRIEYR